MNQDSPNPDKTKTSGIHVAGWSVEADVDGVGGGGDVICWRTNDAYHSDSWEICSGMESIRDDFRGATRIPLLHATPTRQSRCQGRGTRLAAFGAAARLSRREAEHPSRVLQMVPAPTVRLPFAARATHPLRAVAPQSIVVRAAWSGALLAHKECSRGATRLVHPGAVRERSLMPPCAFVAPPVPGTTSNTL